MKASRPVILLSLAANVALAAVLLWRTASPPAATIHAPSSGSAAAASAAKPPAPAFGPETWKFLNADSDAEFVARLRAEGFPPDMLYSLVQARVRARHAEALNKFRPPVDYDYWRTSPFTNDPPLEERAARRALERQIREEMKQLLGPDSDRTTIYQRANRERLYGNISPEKADQLIAIERDYGDVSQTVREKQAKGVILDEDRAHLIAIEAEKRADLAQLLSPQELREYDLRSSVTANTVRYGLRAFEATEEEFRALTTLQLAFDATYGGLYLTQEQQQRRILAAPELTAQIKALLPPDRYAEYEIKTDQTYLSIASLVSQYSSPADATAVVGAQRDFAQRFNALRNNRDLAPAVRDAQLDALAAEANSRMAAALGPEAFSSYKGNGGPINALLNRPPRKP